MLTALLRKSFTIPETFFLNSANGSHVHFSFPCRPFYETEVSYFPVLKRISWILSINCSVLSKYYAYSIYSRSSLRAIALQGTEGYTEYKPFPYELLVDLTRQIPGPTTCQLCTWVSSIRRLVCVPMGVLDLP